MEIEMEGRVIGKRTREWEMQRKRKGKKKGKGVRE